MANAVIPIVRLATIPNVSTSVAREPAPAGRSQLAELTDCGRGGFRPGRQGHRDRKREQDGRNRWPKSPRDGRAAMSDDRMGESRHQHGGATSDEQHGHDGEDQPPSMPKPGQTGNEDQKHQPELDP
jgi:hypothetical protein